MNILGISAFYHDSAAVLVRDGQIIAAAQEERFTRKKHDFHFPQNAIKYCLEEGHVGSDELDFVVFYDKPFLKFARILESYLQYAPRGLNSFIKAMPLWIKQKLWIKHLIQENLPGFNKEILFPEHHRSHAASAFFPSPFEEAAIINADGVGEWTTTSIGLGKDNQIKIMKEIHFPHSIGMLYSAFTYYTGFIVNSGEYKVMGLAPYGEPKYVKVILDNLIDLKDDGSFRLNMEYFNYAFGLTMTGKKFEKLFDSPPRKRETALRQKDMDLARSIQEVIEMVLLKMAAHARAITGSSNLVLAGGVALNCVANAKILNSGIFDNIWIQPAAGDAGGALGAALTVWYEHLDNSRINNGHDSMSGAFLGPEFSDKDITGFLDSHTIPYKSLPEEDVISHAAELLAEEKVIGWFQGRMEFGPRALGGRSILGDPRSASMQKKLNLKIKYRESFRPFAPSILEEESTNFFQTEQKSPYMLLTADVKKEIRKEMTETEKQLFGIERLNVVRSTLPAVTHVDYSARLQTVNRGTNPKYWKLICKFKDLTGCPVLVNTSFNVRGEPIVCNPIDAYKCFMRTEMDYLVVGNCILDKKEQPEVFENINWREQFEPD